MIGNFAKNDKAVYITERKNQYDEHLGPFLQQQHSSGNVFDVANVVK